MVVDVVFLEVGEKESRLCLFHTRLLLFSHQFLFFFSSDCFICFQEASRKSKPKPQPELAVFFLPSFFSLFKKKKKVSDCGAHCGDVTEINRVRGAGLGDICGVNTGGLHGGYTGDDSVGMCGCSVLLHEERHIFKSTYVWPRSPSTVFVSFTLV